MGVGICIVKVWERKSHNFSLFLSQWNEVTYYHVWDEMRWGRTQRGEREHKVPLVGVGAVSGAYVRETETQRAGRVRLWQYMRQIYNKNPHIPPAPYFRRTPPSVGLRFHKKKKSNFPFFSCVRTWRRFSIYHIISTYYLYAHYSQIFLSAFLDPWALPDILYESVDYWQNS